MNKIFLKLLTFILVIAMLFSITNSGNTELSNKNGIKNLYNLSIVKRMYSPEIYIDGNDDFLKYPGSGTKEDPYRIENDKIEGNYEKIGIYIKNTTVYFIIQNYSISNESVGIVFENVTNGKIFNTTLSNLLYSGIYFLKNCYNNSVISSDINASDIGIKIDGSHHIVIKNKTDIHSSSKGILLVNSKFTEVERCEVYENHIGIIIDNSTNNNIISCNIQNNVFGFWVNNSSSHNNFYHNVFEENKLHAYDDCDNDKWNTSSDNDGGNYWGVHMR